MSWLGLHTPCQKVREAPDQSVGNVDLGWTEFPSDWIDDDHVRHDEFFGRGVGDAEGEQQGQRQDSQGPVPGRRQNPKESRSAPSANRGSEIPGTSFRLPAPPEPEGPS